MKQWCTNYKFSQNEFASRYSTQSYIYTRHVFFAHLSFQTHDPTQPTKNANFRPIPDPTQPNPRVNPTHGQLWSLCLPHADIVSERLNLSWNFFWTTGSLIILVFTPCANTQFQGEPLQRGSWMKGVGKIGDFRLKSPFITETVRDRTMVTMEL